MASEKAAIAPGRIAMPVMSRLREIPSAPSPAAATPDPTTHHPAQSSVPWTVVRSALMTPNVALIPAQGRTPVTARARPATTMVRPSKVLVPLRSGVGGCAVATLSTLGENAALAPREPPTEFDGIPGEGGDESAGTGEREHRDPLGHFGLPGFGLGFGRPGFGGGRFGARRAVIRVLPTQRAVPNTAGLPSVSGSPTTNS